MSTTPSGCLNDDRIDHYVPSLSDSQNRTHADRRVLVLLRMYRLRDLASAQERRLLRVLLLRLSPLSPDPSAPEVARMLRWRFNSMPIAKPAGSADVRIESFARPRLRQFVRLGRNPPSGYGGQVGGQITSAERGAGDQTIN